jgi:hypothetical protein
MEIELINFSLRRIIKFHAFPFFKIFFFFYLYFIFFYSVLNDEEDQHLMKYSHHIILL